MADLSDHQIDQLVNTDMAPIDRILNRLGSAFYDLDSWKSKAVRGRIRRKRERRILKEAWRVHSDSEAAGNSLSKTANLLRQTHLFDLKNEQDMILDPLSVLDPERVLGNTGNSTTDSDYHSPPSTVPVSDFRRLRARAPTLHRYSQMLCPLPIKNLEAVVVSLPMCVHPLLVPLRRKQIPIKCMREG